MQSTFSCNVWDVHGSRSDAGVPRGRHMRDRQVACEGWVADDVGIEGESVLDFIIAELTDPVG